MRVTRKDCFSSQQSIALPVTKWVGFFPTLTNSPKPAGCPTIQVSSDTLYQGLASDPTSQELRAQDCATPDTNHQSKVDICASDLQLYVGVSMTPWSGSIVC